MWVGKYKERITADVVVRKCVWRFLWGVAAPNLVVMEDNNGNIITIRSAAKFNVGDKWNVSGIVKRHSTIRGQRQTHLKHWELSI